jgi:formylglycine-generating enzyme required for sulfatase activity
LTGETYRLPAEDEAASLYSPREGENTLDHWAGYALNPEDADRLASKLADLGGTAPLLKEVGSFAGAGAEDEELVFDLGGNVAEWVTTKDGQDKTMGGSADRASDPKARARDAAILYTGFRVVRVAPKSK